MFLNLHAQHHLNKIAWHVGVLDNRWYIKPRSTCWFDEFFFRAYPLDHFYYIMHMKRRTSHHLWEDLRPCIQGQASIWRNPICVEKKAVMIMYEFIHDTLLPLVVDKAVGGGGQCCVTNYL